jgi:hypothetical protein
MDPVKRSFWRTGGVVALGFALGMAAGALTFRAVEQRRLRELVMGDPAVMRTRLTMRALENRLELTPDQRAEAERVLHAQEASYREALEPCRPPVRELRREMARRLEPVLNDAQRSALDALVREGERYR